MDDRFNRKDKPEGQEVIVSHDADGGLVLLHRLALDTAASAEAREGLLQMTHASATFRHPHVLAVREVRLEEGSLVFVQEHPDGPLLADRLERNGPVPLPEALRWMRQFAQGLGAAQASGLTLSQICPTEFLIQEASPGGLLCLCPPVPTGWWLDVEDAPFASPEQKAGQACDIRSTMYSAGAVLAAMLTNQRPANATGWSKILTKAKLPKAVNKALYAVLEADQSKRCATPAEWIALLDQAIAALPLSDSKALERIPAKEMETTPKRAVAPLAGNRSQGPSRVEMGEAVFESTVGNHAKTGMSPALVAAGAVVLVLGAWMLLPKKDSASKAAPAAQINEPQPAASTQSKPTETPVASEIAAAPALKPAPLPAEPKVSVAASTPPPTPTSAPVPEPEPAPIPVAKPPAMPAAPPPVAPEAVAGSAAAAPSKVETKEDPVSKPAPVATIPPPQSVPPKPEPPPMPATVATVAPVPAAPDPAPEAKPATKEDLLQQAAQATGPARTEAYRKVLALDAKNPKALHGLVEAALPDPPATGKQRNEFTAWANELASQDDPLGTHALAALTLQQAGDTKSPETSIKIYTAAIAQLKASLGAGYDGSYPVLIQAYIALHQAHILNHEKPKADRVSKALQDEIARIPSTIPAKVPADLATSIDALLKEKSTKGPPRMQEAFLKVVMQSLYAAAAKQGGDAPQKRAKARR